MKKKLFTILVAVMLTCIIIPTTTATALASTDVSTQSRQQEEIRFTESQTYSTRSTENFSFVSYEELETNTTINKCPTYYYTAYPNACGAVAGADVIGFYDKYYEDLIPDYVSYYPASGKYRAMDMVKIPALVGNLYTLMRTNVDDVGVSHADFMTGLSQYVSNKNHTLSYTDVFTNGSVNYTAIKSAIDQNKPLVIFCDETDVALLAMDGNTESIDYTHISSAHIMVVYGYYKIRYYFADNTTRTDTYLMLSTGLNTPTTAFYNINTSNDIIDIQVASIN